MRIRKKVEQLALWWIPAVLVAAAFSAFYAKQFSGLIDSQTSDISMAYFVYVSFFGTFINHADNIAVSIWLFLTTRDEQNTRPALWSLLGLVTGIIGAILYIAVCIYEQRDADA